MSKINAIFAVDWVGGLGNNGTLPWPKIQEDFDWFKQHTLNNIVVMGRNTWDDPKMPKPLVDRVNYVVTNRPLGSTAARTIRGSNYKEEILNLRRMYPNKEVFIIGGKTLLEDCRDIIDNLYLTIVKGSYKVDTKLKIHEYLAGFRARTAIPGDKCTFMIYSNENISRKP